MPNEPTPNQTLNQTPNPTPTPALGLTATWETVHGLLRGEVDIATAAARLGVPVERLAVYPRFVKDHVRGAIEKNHAILASLLRGPVWETLVDGYFAAHPAHAYELNEAASTFASFVGARLTGGEPGLLPFHRDLASLEWQEWGVYASPARIPPPPAVTRPTLNPTLVILSHAHPVGRFVSAWRRAAAQGAEPPAVPAPETETVFVFRHPTTHRVLSRPATPDLLFAFKVAHDGLDVDGAARLAGLAPPSVDALLAAAAQTGLVVLPAESFVRPPSSAPPNSAPPSSAIG